MPMRTVSQLKQLGAKDATERDIKTNDLLEVRCVSCENTKSQEWHYITRRFNERGYGYKCENCHSNEKKNPITSTVTHEKLKEMLAVDTSERIITSNIKVEFYCYNESCRSRGFKTYAESIKTFKRVGYYYKCRPCVRKDNGSELSKKEGWREKISKSLKNSQKAKHARIRLSIKKMVNKDIKNVLDYWEFDTDIRKLQNTVVVSGVCKKCKNTQNKQIKKFLEALSNETKGCSNCWNSIISSDEYKERMGERSRNMDPEIRAVQVAKTKLFWKNTSIEYRIIHGAKSWAGITEEEKERRVKQSTQHLMSFWRNIPKEVAEEIRLRNADNLKKDDPKVEKDLKKLLSGWGVESKKINIAKHQIDLYAKDFHIGIEHNGLIWHSTYRKDNNNYHLEKTEFFKNRGIRIIHIWGDEWEFYPKRVMSYLKSAFGKNAHRIGARQTELREVSVAEASPFLDEYHLSGSCVFELALGLYYNNELISLATFGKHHRGNDKRMVMSRFVTKFDWTVVGALSKLSKEGAKRFGEIITWADLRLTDGNCYEKSGWTKEEILPPDFFYIKGNRRFSKQSQKRKPTDPINETELARTTRKGMYRVYDCGKIRFTYKYPNNSKDLSKHK